MHPGFVLSLISWLFFSQYRHTIYQIRARYLSYRMVPVISILVKGFKIYVLKRAKFDIFFHTFFEHGSLI